MVNAGVASDHHLSSPLRVATIGIVSDRVNDVASKCLPAVALMTATAAIVVVAGGCGRPKLFELRKMVWRLVITPLQKFSKFNNASTGYVQVSTYVCTDGPHPQRCHHRRLTTGKHPMRSSTAHY